MVILSIAYRNIADSDVWDGRCCDDTEEDECDERLGKTHDEQSQGGECEWRIREQRNFSAEDPDVLLAEFGPLYVPRC